MKKKFVEPEMVRIELKMTENIADSEQYDTSGYGELAFPVYTRQFVDHCQKYYVLTEIEPYIHGITDTNELVKLIAGGRCFTNPADQARALMMYGR